MLRTDGDISKSLKQIYTDSIFVKIIYALILIQNLSVIFIIQIFSMMKILLTPSCMSQNLF